MRLSERSEGHENRRFIKGVIGDETAQILGMGCGLLLCDGILYGLQTQIGGRLR